VFLRPQSLSGRLLLCAGLIIVGWLVVMGIGRGAALWEQRAGCNVYGTILTGWCLTLNTVSMRLLLIFVIITPLCFLAVPICLIGSLVARLLHR
jgi:hypothetical protein